MRKSMIGAAMSAALAIAFSAGAAIAQPTTPVRTVEIGPDLQTKLEKTYGVDEAQFLKETLARRVERALAKAGDTKVAAVDLVITDATPNRPTFKQLGDNTSLSMASFGVGGAAVEAKLYDSGGAQIGAVEYEWFSPSLEWAAELGTWSDAWRAFDRAAYKIRKAAETES
jgi:hypothetical protein